MPDSLAAVVLAAGSGTRLRPLTFERPKPLCPVGGVALLDHALARTGAVVAPEDTAVNLHHGRRRVEAHLGERGLLGLHRSVEEPEPLGTAGALGRLRPWLGGRSALVTNADAYLPDTDVARFVAGWDRERVRLLCVRDHARGDFGALRYAGVALLPWREVARLAPEPSGLYEVSWRVLWQDGRLDLVAHPGAFVDCGTAADYLAANLLATGGGPSVEPGAKVGGAVVRSVLWSGAIVRPGERLVDAVRTAERTVLIR